MNKKILLSIIISLVFTFSTIGVTPITTDTFTGTSDETTSTFAIEKYAKIDWAYENASRFSYFEAFMYAEGDTYYPDYKINFGENVTGTTYYYLGGTYYFNVTAYNIKNWEIKTTEISGDYLSNQDVITGFYSKNSKIFKSFGDTEITWSTVKANDYDGFFVYIYSPGSSSIVSSFHGENGTKHFDITGEFYLDIITANLINYTINLNVKTNDSSETSPNTVSISNTISGFGFIELSITVPIAVLLVIRRKKD